MCKEPSQEKKKIAMTRKTWEMAFSSSQEQKLPAMETEVCSLRVAYALGFFFGALSTKMHATPLQKYTSKP